MSRQLDSFVVERFSRLDFDSAIRFVRRLKVSRSTIKQTSRVVQRAKKASRRQVKKVKSIFDALPVEERMKLIQELERKESLNGAD